MTRRVAVLSLLITLTLPVLAGAAQSVSTGAIEGSVSTPTPAVRLAGAMLTVTDRRGAEVARTASDGAGRFTIGDRRNLGSGY